MKKKVLLRLYFLILFFIPVVAYANTDLTIMPISTSNWGDSTLLESNGEYLLMDVTYAKTAEVLDFLISNNVEKFDIYLSHYHADHYGGYNKLTTVEDSLMDFIEYIIRNKGKGGYKNYIYDVGILYLPDPSICDNTGNDVCKKKYKSLTEAALDMGIEVQILTTNSEFTVGNTKAKVLYLNNDESIDSFSNNSSLVTMFTNGKTKFLTAGDIEEYTEKKLLNLGIDISADIFKLNHHGIQKNHEISNIDEFVRKVQPKYSYFQFQLNGEYNYDYSAIKQTIENLSSFSNIYTTQVNGNIKFVIENDFITPVVDKNSYSVTINYIDKEEEKILETRTYHFSYDFYGNEIKYHLYGYEKEFEGYSLEDYNNIKSSGVLTEDVTYNLYYSKIIKNPDTGIDLSYCILILIIIISSIIYIFICKKTKFAKHN